MTLAARTTLALGLALGLTAAPAAQALEDGDTVRLVVPYSPGGGYDAQARLAAPYVEAALGAQGLDVEVVVENITGGAGAIATATVFAARPDGTTLLFLDPESSIWQQALAGAPFRVDEFSFIAQMSIDPMVFMIRTDLGLETFEDVIARSAETPILMGTSGKGGYDHIMPVIMEKMLNDAGQPIRFEFIHFEGTAPILASMRRGEAEGSLEVISTFGAAEEAGELAFLFDFIANDVPEGRWPDAADVTAIPEEELALLASAMNYRRVFVGPPGVAEDTLATLRAAFATALADPELLAKSLESRRPIAYLGGAEIEAAIRKEAALAENFAPYVRDAID
jgi:tripartite-type tricarboxylate transporter receptor subunit TctC